MQGLSDCMINSPEMDQLDHELMVSLLRQALQQGEHPTLKVISGSMSPMIMKNDLVKLSPFNFETLKKGDIITLTQREALTTHRVVSRRNDTVVTKGDRNLTLDEPITKNQIIGKVTKIKSKQFNKTIDLEASKSRWAVDLISFITHIDFAIKRRLRNFAKPVSVIASAVIRRLIKTL